MPWSKTLELCVETLHFFCSLSVLAFCSYLGKSQGQKYLCEGFIQYSYLAFLKYNRKWQEYAYIPFQETLYNAAVYNNCNSMRELCFVIWIWQNATVAYEMQTRERLCNHFTNANPEECRFDSRAGCFLIDHISKLSQSGWMSANKNNLSILHKSISLIYKDTNKMWHFLLFLEKWLNERAVLICVWWSHWWWWWWQKLTGQWSGGWQASLVKSKDISMTQKRQAHMPVIVIMMMMMTRTILNLRWW